MLQTTYRVFGLLITGNEEFLTHWFLLKFQRQRFMF